MATKTLVNDEGGAVMIIGLAMILSLIAFLWYILGIGETFAFRDHMQDAADSAAFSQTAVEAAGMNLIVLLNMIIMLLVIVYLIASILLTIYWATMVANLAMCFEVIGGEVDCAIGLDQLANYPGLYDDRGDLGSALSILDMGLSLLESAVAILAPWAGTAGGIDASMAFKMSSMSSAPIGISLSPNNFPDLAAITSLGKDLTAEYGLPVTHEVLGNDCAHLIDMTAGAINGLLGGKGGSIINKVAGAAGVMFQWYYCDPSETPPVPGLTSVVGKVIEYLDLPIHEILGGGDAASYWQDKGYGPMKNYNHVDVKRNDVLDGMKATEARHDKEQKNGADHNQSYSVLLMPGDLSDHHATSNMGLAQLQNLKGFGIAEQKAKPLFYFAQAELYFDCDKGWRSADCDDVSDNEDHVDMTMYSFAWRARLVKFHAPEGSALDKVLGVINKGLGMVTDVKGWINGNQSNPFIQILQFIDKVTGVDVIGIIGGFADLLPVQIFH